MKYFSVTEKAPPEGQFLFTKIVDSKGTRNIQELKKQGRLWFSRDGLYVYYEPTHWAPINVPCSEKMQRSFDRHYFNW